MFTVELKNDMFMIHKGKKLHTNIHNVVTACTSIFSQDTYNVRLYSGIILLVTLDDALGVSVSQLNVKGQ